MVCGSFVCVEVPWSRAGMLYAPVPDWLSWLVVVPGNNVLSNAITYTYFNTKWSRVQIMNLDDWWSSGGLWRMTGADSARVNVRWNLPGTRKPFPWILHWGRTIRESVQSAIAQFYVWVPHQTDCLSATHTMQLIWRFSNKTKVCHKFFSMCQHGKEKKTDCRLWLFVTMAGHLNREVQVYRGVKLLNLSFCPPTIPENCSLKQNLLDQ